MFQRLSLNELGIVVTLAAAFLLLHRYRSAPRVAPFPRYGTTGAAIVFAGQLLTMLGVAPVAIYFTAIAWTGYILWLDAAIFALRGRSPLRSFPKEFAALALCSGPLWLVFELYNLHLSNWLYVGLPQNALARHFGFAWAFATVWPGIFLTATLLRALGWAQSPPAPAEAARLPRLAALRGVAAVGAVLLVLPLLVPSSVAAYLFGAVWLGFIFLLEPINLRTGRESLWRDLLRGDSSRLKALLWAGLLCGLWWEFWNYWAVARWVYTVPILPEYRVFAMPVLGYLGFPPFAVECFAMFAFVAPLLGRLFHGMRKPSWEILKL